MTDDGARGRLVGLIGDPVRHSLSPAIHRAAYEALGLDWTYAAFEVPAEHFSAACHGAKALGLRGLSVTMPHKHEAATIATRRSPAVRRLGAANTLSFDAAGIVADSTDGDGILDDLREGAGFAPAGRRCGVIGAGGAGRAVVLALAGAGAAEVLIVNRTPVKAFRAAALAPGIGRVARPEELDGCDLVVQATPLTMTAEAEGLGVDPGRFGSGQLVYDVVYLPSAEAFWQSAAANGATVRNGLGMLVHQAARQVRIWSGCEPPLPAMWAAVRPGG
jgi:shikimate dehydrogenase